MFKATKYDIIFLAVLTVSSVFSQKESNKWYFGNLAALDFNSNPPNILTNSAMNTLEGCASVADTSGNLLFYTDGMTIWNQLHVPMANGTGLLGHNSTTQSSLIIKKPASGNLYYVFTLDQLGMSNGLMYSVVDMSLAAGMGSVTVKNVPLFAPSTEKLTGTKHCNGTDFWVLTHDYNSNNFRAYLLTASGVNASPIISSIGTTHSTTSGYFNAMKISPTGNRIGLSVALGTSLSTELYDFDISTGIVSNSMVISTSLVPYGCEFSPDGTKFYGARFYEFYQWDLCAGSATAIAASIYTSSSSVFMMSMQLAPNGKIYVARSTGQTIGTLSDVGVINNPNVAGVACNYVDQGQSIAPKTSRFGLPNFITSSVRVLPAPFTYTFICNSYSFASQTTTAGCLAIGNNSIVSQTWFFGDPTSGAANTSSLQNPSHIYSASGTYTVRLIFQYNCTADTLEQIIAVSAIPTLSVAGSLSLCKGQTSVLSASGANSYTWNTNIISPTVAISPTVTSSYTVAGSGVNPSCVTQKIVTVTVNTCVTLNGESDSDPAPITIYPNPFSENIVLDTPWQTQVIIYDNLGRIMIDCLLHAGKNIINTQFFDPGIYLVLIKSHEAINRTRLIKSGFN